MHTITPFPAPRQITATARYYVPLPQRLLLDLRDTPLAIGVYALVARTYRRSHAPVPLSSADLAAFDRSLSRGAASRALRRLRERGYLLATPSGRKLAYTPTWGHVHDTPVAWDLHAACLGRPRHIRELRLAQELLDTCLGQIEPHPQHAVLISRLVSTPLLSLRDVGAYTLYSIGLSAKSPTLAKLGLIKDGQAQPVPPTATILAVATQRAWGTGETLTEAGWAQTAFSGAPTPTDQAAGSPLFFVPVERVGELIGDRIAYQIGQPAISEPASSATECAKPASSIAETGSHESDQKIESTTSGGGFDQPVKAEPTNEVARLLREVQINQRVAASFADAPVAAITQAIELARKTTGVRDQARWIVGVLRDWQARGWPSTQVEAPPPARVTEAAILFHSGISGRERQIWLARFRAAEPADRQAILDRFSQEVGHDPAA